MHAATTWATATELRVTNPHVFLLYIHVETFFERFTATLEHRSSFAMFRDSVSYIVEHKWGQLVLS